MALKILGIRGCPLCKPRRPLSIDLEKPFLKLELYFKDVCFQLNTFSRLRVSDFFPKILHYKPLCIRRGEQKTVQWRISLTLTSEKIHFRFFESIKNCMQPEDILFKLQSEKNFAKVMNAWMIEWNEWMSNLKVHKSKLWLCE